MSKFEDGVTGGTGNEGNVKGGPSRRVSLASIKGSRTQQWLLAALLFVLLLAAIPLTWFTWQYARVNIPQPGEIETAQISKIYFSDGVTELART
ncbi:penicillin-binding protein, partial [Corynebacterium sanguinis]|nr:penicillin-binding protein [Corynebacterium sanguinis]